MTHRNGAIWTERLILVMILGSLAGTLNLVLTVHRRAVSLSSALEAQTPQPAPPPTTREAPRVTEVAAAHPSPSKPRPATTSPSPPSPPPIVEDPTVPILDRMTRAMGKEIEAARQADGRAAKLESARQAAVAESERWKRRELLVRQQIATLTHRAERLEQDASALDAERDVLAHERDVLKAALVKASRRSGAAVLPYKGPNGTWRRPIVLECTGNVARLQPHGPTFSMLELSPLIHPRASPVVLAIAREMLHIEQGDTPDGAPVVPYLVFLVRPNGIRPYYEARTRLEPLGIAFGYELIEQDLVVDVPDFDDLTTWDGTVPIEAPALAARTAPPRAGRPAATGTGEGVPSNAAPELAWGQDLRRGHPAGAAEAAGAGPNDASPEDFVWPSPARRARPGGGPGSSPSRWGAGDDPGPARAPAAAGAAPSSPFAFGDGNAPQGGGPAWGGSPAPLGRDGAGMGRGTEATRPPSGRAPWGQGQGGPEPGPPGLFSGGRSGSIFSPRGGGITAPSAPGSTRDQGASGTASGWGLDGTGGGAPNALPDLEPARDDASTPAMPPGGGSLSGAPASGAARGRFPGGGAGPVGAGPPPDGPGPSGSKAGALGGNPIAGSSSGPAGSTPGGGSDSSPESPNPPGATRAAASTNTPESLTASRRPGWSSASSSSPTTAAGAGSASPSTAGWDSSPAASGSSSAWNELAGLTSSSAGSTSSSPGSRSGSSGASGSPSTASGMSLPSLSWNPESGPGDFQDFTPPPLAPPDRPPGAIEVPFEIVVVCRPGDVLLHPGGYRISTQALREGGGKGANPDSLLKRELRAMVQRRAQVDPLIRPRPSLKFLVETEGATTFWTARRQLLFSGLDWPMSIQVAGPQTEQAFHRETRP